MKWNLIKSFWQTRVNAAIGQSLVELAIAIPILITLLVGVVEVVFACHTYLVLLDAASIGARIGAVGSFYSDSSVYALVQQTLAREGYSPGSLVDVIVVRANVDGASVTGYATNNILGSGRTPVLTQSVLASRLRSGDPASRVVGVEVVYNHEQLLKVPFLSRLIPDPLLLRAYSVQLVQR